MSPGMPRLRAGALPRRPTVWRLLGALLLVGIVPASVMADGSPVLFRVQYVHDVHEGPFTGRVYLFFSRQPDPEPRFGPSWFDPEPFLAADVSNLEAEVPVTISTADAENVITFPRSLTADELGGSHAQAVLRFNPRDHRVGTGTGNGYSAPIQLPQHMNQGKPYTLVVRQLVPPRRFVETDNLKLLRVRSGLLSGFYGRDVFVQGAVILPSSYARHPDRRFPVLFIVPGFGGDHFHGVRLAKRLAERAQKRGAIEFIRIVLDPSCPRGHHVFADSANNGPVGTSLVSEFIPELDLRYRTIPAPTARFLMGHSSGGWSSLWLQVTYPDVFGGTWSTAPDPVDFRDFQRVDLYEDGNLFVDVEGEPRPLARRNGSPVLWFQGFSDMERVLGHGGQLHSFEACFSPQGPDGGPQPLWNRTTGAIDSAVAQSWQKYDIQRVVKDNWAMLGPRLRGKIHIHTGDQDTFYLDGAVALLKQTLAALGSDANVEIHPGRTHGDLLTAELRARILDGIVDRFQKAWPHWPRQASAE